MRMNKIKSLFALLIVFLLSLSLAPGLAAKQKAVTFENGKVVAFEPGSVYADSDLFDNFKGVMPGDTRTEQIEIRNRCDDFDYLKVYLRAEANTPENIKSVANPTAETAAEMNDFLAQLSLKVWNGDKLIYNASPDKTDGLTKNVYLGSIRKNEVINLKAELSVPLTLSNKYADRMGEVDWVFLCEGFDEPAPPVDLTVRKVWEDTGKDRPATAKMALYNGDKAVETVTLSEKNHWTHTWKNLDGSGSWQIVEVDVPKNYVPSYAYDKGVVTVTNTSSLIETGQLNWPIPVLGGLGAILLSFGLVVLLKKRKEERS